MRETLRRSVLAAGGTLLAGGLLRKCIPAARAEASGQASGQAGAPAGPPADTEGGHPAVQPFSVVTSHAPSILPKIVFTDADGHASSLDAFAGQGVVLNLWATWCVPCVAELPSLDALSRTLAPRNIRVLAVSIDHDGAARVAPFFAAHGIRSLPILFDPHGAILNAIGQEGIPMTLLVNRAGREVARVQGSVDWADPKAADAVARLVG